MNAHKASSKAAPSTQGDGSGDITDDMYKEALKTSGIEKCLDCMGAETDKQRIQERLKRAYRTKKSDIKKKRRKVSRSGRKKILQGIGCPTMREEEATRRARDASGSLTEQLYVISSEILQTLQEGPLKQKYRQMFAASYLQVQEDNLETLHTDLLIARTDLLLQSNEAETTTT